MPHHLSIGYSVITLSAALIALASCAATNDTDPNSSQTTASSSSAGGVGGEGGAGGASTGSSGGFDPVGSGGAGAAPQFAELWYSVDDRLVHFTLDKSDGSVSSVEQSVISNPPPVGLNLMTMMPDGSLLGARKANTDQITHFYHVPDPPRDGSPVTTIELGTMIDGLALEALYTDCDGRVYGMDTGVDSASPEGNRLLRFTGDVLASDFSYTVVSNLSTSTVADIDDMSPGIVDNAIQDNPGFAIDSGTVHTFDYETGVGMELATGGTFGIHALGGELFDDGVARLYVFESNGELFEMNPVSLAVSGPLATGPTDVQSNPGQSGLAGPLTNCQTGFTPK